MMISVIVPIYNIETYLPKCLDSLSSQTYNDIEFILIDDGSTDRSRKITDDYTEIDERIKVFHTGNHGLSAARNLGIEKARGEWLMFVDGDDYVEPDFCEKPYRAAIENDADMVIFRACKVKQGRVIQSKSTPPEGLIDQRNAVIWGGAAVWNKLYRKGLFDAIRYPAGKAFEDLAVTHKIVFNANRIVMLPDFLYYWVYRKDSLGHRQSAKSKRDGFEFALQYTEDLRIRGFEERDYMPLLWSKTLLYLIQAEPSEDPMFLKATEVVDSIKGIPDRLPLKYKAALLAWNISPTFFHTLCRLVGQKDNSMRTQQ